MQCPLSAEVMFNGNKLTTIRDNGTEFVAMRPIVEGIGLNWKTQYRKLTSQKEKFGCGHMTIPSSGGPQQMLCMPLRKLNGWLFSINPAKVKIAIRERLVAYQEECFKALHDYWVNGFAARKPLPLSEAEIEAHDISRFDAVTFVEASKGSGSMLARKKAKQIIKERIIAWEEKYFMQFNFVLMETGKGRLTRS
ncbi:hypothetical protein FCN80_23505 [Martelella alba]|uniref:Antirepressor protein ant N-terminal domain-containing protein n=2 Tax=Martelella alba TaxID=2590451 RepID=A0ABY2SEH5_9HYPH|nr:hypothetical protein FCN80_23505 [Martelella alba]